MALLTDRDVNFYVSQELVDFPVDANMLIYKGALVGRSRSTGYARPLIAGDDFLGLAFQKADNTFPGNAGGSTLVRLHRRIDIVHAISGATQADVGKEVYASTDETLVLSPAGNSRVGRIVAIETTGVARVNLQPQSVTSGVNENLAVIALPDANGTLTLDHLDRTLLMGNSAARTVILPPVAQVRAGGWIRLVKTSAAAFAITLDGNASETIDGAATYAGVDAAYDTVLLFCTGTDWVILSRDIA